MTPPASFHSRLSTLWGAAGVAGLEVESLLFSILKALGGRHSR